MLKTIEVVFDGKAFVPSQPVDLPAGTRLNLTVRQGLGGTLPQLIPSKPRPLTEEEEKKWEELCRHWEATPPPFATVEEAISYSRGRPWPRYESMPESDDAAATDEEGKEVPH